MRRAPQRPDKARRSRPSSPRTTRSPQWVARSETASLTDHGGSGRLRLKAERLSVDWNAHPITQASRLNVGGQAGTRNGAVVQCFEGHGDDGAVGRARARPDETRSSMTMWSPLEKNEGRPR